MSQPITLPDIIKSAPETTSLSGLFSLLTDQQGLLKKIGFPILCGLIGSMICNPAEYVTNIDEATSPGIFLLDGGDVPGTFPNLTHSNFGHLCVLRRLTTVQQILVCRNGFALRFRTLNTPWQEWKLIPAT